jgi:hypothetical protein
VTLVGLGVAPLHAISQMACSTSTLAQRLLAWQGLNKNNFSLGLADLHGFIMVLHAEYAS